MTTKKKAQKVAADKSDREELDAFATHMAEVLRIVRANPLISGTFYRDLGGAWNECINELNCFSDSSLQESEEYIRLALFMEADREGGAE